MKEGPFFGAYYLSRGNSDRPREDEQGLFMAHSEMQERSATVLRAGKLLSEIREKLC